MTAPAAGEVVRRAGFAMLEELASNLYEDQTFRRLVDFGHTVSPALEAASGFRLAHGQAVAVDAALSTAIGAQLGLVTPEDRDSIFDGLTACGLPIYSTYLTPALFQEALREAMRHRGGAINLVVPTRVGSAEFLVDGTELNECLFRRVVSILKQRMAA